MKHLPIHSRGFSLVEVIVVMVVTGILGGIVAVFLRMPVQNYVDAAGRAELSDVADSAIRRMAREIRLAVPNTVRLSGNSIEFVPAKTGGRYLAVEDGVGGNYLSFTDTSQLSFAVVGPMPVGKQAIVANDYIVVYNLGEGFAPADAYSGQNRALVNSVNSGSKLITMATNPFASQSPSMTHPQYRFVVANQPVTYVCSGGASGTGSLFRYSNYGFNASQVAVPTGATVATLATNVASCTFSFTALQNTRAGLVGLTISVQRSNSTDGALSLSHQVHVDNTP